MIEQSDLAFDVDQDAVGLVLDEAAQVEPMSEMVYEGTGADALNDSPNSDEPALHDQPFNLERN